MPLERWFIQNIQLVETEERACERKQRRMKVLRTNVPSLTTRPHSIPRGSAVLKLLERLDDVQLEDLGQDGAILGACEIVLGQLPELGRRLVDDIGPRLSQACPVSTLGNLRHGHWMCGVESDSGHREDRHRAEA